MKLCVSLDSRELREICFLKPVFVKILALSLYICISRCTIKILLKPKKAMKLPKQKFIQAKNVGSTRLSNILDGTDVDITSMQYVCQYDNLDSELLY